MTTLNMIFSFFSAKTEAQSVVEKARSQNAEKVRNTFAAISAQENDERFSANAARKALAHLDIE